MPRIVTIHQPNYLPWIGLFAKVSLADCLIIYDDAQYEKNSVINRSKIRINDGSIYLTIPVGKLHTQTRILDVRLPTCDGWKQKHWNYIHMNYARSPFFDTYTDYFRNLYRQNSSSLAEFNEKIIRYLLSCFNINVEIIRTSQLEVDPGLYRTDRMIAYLKETDANIYLSGPSSRTYLEIAEFPQNDIVLKFFKFRHPVYQQRYPGFESNMSAIDLLFNAGPESGEIIAGSAEMEGIELAGLAAVPAGRTFSETAHE